MKEADLPGTFVQTQESATLTRLLKSKELLWAWTGRTIRGRYQQSLLGWLWAVIQPAVSVIILTIVFTRFVRVNTGDTPYILFSFVGVIPWTLLSNSLQDMADSLVLNMNLITKIYLPREVLPIAAMLARFTDFFVAAVVFVVLLIVYQLPIFTIPWLFLPLILIVQLLLIAGIGLTCSALNVFYRDVKSLLALGIQIWFYASPIIYPVTMVPEPYRRFYLLNPMVGILQAYRDVLISGVLPGSSFMVSLVLSVVIFIAGYGLFRKVEHLFADIV